ncbi:VTT domain-containing protein [Nitrosospira sp. Is2]|uniref:VTT domain-containing protein n=1 Tax=Nitrosospira sp. Is2 TaxID=3080532 RepID=UPI0029531A86|nr:VTT domain-containing protein [Nitrosospira sp. Is2]WON73761.1 VTT domain-containing protein [Nitrosospira sp. Is2]
MEQPSPTIDADKENGEEPGYAGRSPILDPGRNCWRIEHADRVAFLVDGAEYFRAFREVVKQAQRSVLIIAWDIDSRVELAREHEPDGFPFTLAAFLNSMLKRNDQLHIYVLDWDFPMLMAADREWLPLLKEEWTAHPRLHFHLDDRYPPGGSHHQKIVVVDDKVAFVGGLDLTTGRWDTPEHRPDDLRRCDLGAGPVPQPYHDIQMMVRGPIAITLGDLARERWMLATGQALDTPHVPSGPSYWPQYLSCELENAPVAIARTVPAYENQAEVREIEPLLLDAIAAAHKSIYIEAQYFTANKVVAALQRRLEDPDGPEIVIVLPVQTAGWLSQSTMDVLRERLFKQLLNADHYNRLRLYWPEVPGLDDDCVNVHSKIILIDDELLRIGSANLNNRSMGVDTECDLVIEANGEARIQNAVAAFRHRLLGEHLGKDPAEIAAVFEHEGSLIRAIECLSGPGRNLRPMQLKVTPEMDELVPDIQVIDPDQPINPDELINGFVPEEEREPARNHLTLIIVTLLVVLALAIAWRWSPLKEWINIETLTALGVELKQAPSAPFLALATFVIAGLVAFPLTVLIIVCGLVFGPLQGFLYSLVGALLSAMLTFSLGYLLGRNTVRRFAGRKLGELNRRLARRGLMTIIIVRIIPLAPFTVINMVAGASRIRFRDFVLGSAIGLLPGIIGMSVFTERLAAAIEKPNLPAFATLAVVVAILIASGWAIWRWENRRRASRLRAETD